MKLKITVHGIAYEVDVEVLDPGEGFAPRPSSVRAPAAVPPPSGRSGAPAPPAPAPRTGPPPAPAGGDAVHTVASPIAGVVAEVSCKAGDSINQGDVLLVIEAMKMNNSITAPTSGRIKAVPVAAGDSVREGQTLVQFE